MQIQENNNIKKWLVFNSAVFVLFLITGAILFLILPKDKISMQEKRKLSPFPDFSFDNWVSGKYTDSINNYYSDNFIFRNELIDLASKVKKIKGIEDEEIVFFKQPIARVEKKPIFKDSKDNKNAGSVQDSVSVGDSLSNDTSRYKPKHFVEGIENYDNINSIILYKKRAILIFGGSKPAAKNYANMVIQFKNEYPEMNVFCLAMPCGSDFFLPSSFHKRGYPEKEFIDYFYGQMSGKINCVPAYEELSQHTNEYIQLKTDHHWSGRGAYYAYKAFCKTAGFQALRMDEMTRKESYGFLGSMYGYTQSEVLKTNLDTIEYFKIPGSTKCQYYRSGFTNGSPTKLYHEVSRGTSGYGVFLGADWPLMRVTSENKNGRKILMLKDSYGNAFAPFLAHHYEEVFIIDYRYFNGSIKELIKTYGITDMLFGHNVFVFNAGFTLSREKYLINYKGYDPAFDVGGKKKTEKADSTKK
ncbi:MAG: DHHW family protein [Bacteroidota bacterium]